MTKVVSRQQLTKWFLTIAVVIVLSPIGGWALYRHVDPSIALVSGYAFFVFILLLHTPFGWWLDARTVSGPMRALSQLAYLIVGLAGMTLVMVLFRRLLGAG
ncbi:MAG: hypothetical protein JJ884_02485 [Maricaulis sp.]|uniref:hypothetical protein n=1 Tax=Maricaulis sp. TaxID=1486257 RepID=UPI001B19DC92|nr:hypothetical protein [Maricaulis sp.]MBO6729992.1 hypothetical protein [Maricaulis sp.]MBO6846367.1 hypothetical protein [Maricaulis sp.]MBO6876598.1 hypothetical protein [Maricaulis sp.]MEC9251049.1 hypothetical protein [Pseudomonadota bacterium]